MDLGRRRLLRTGMAALLATGCRNAQPKDDRVANPVRRHHYHVAIVGGGYGGASVARFLRDHSPEIRVTLIEYDKVHATGPGSNWVIAGLKPFPSLLARYGKLKKLGVNIIHDWVAAVDVEGRNLRFDDGSRLGYDRLVLAPGVALNWKAIEGYDAAASEAFPHGWIPGLQTLSLARQLRDLRRGAVVMIAAPDGETSCRQAIYERVSLIAHYLREHKPMAKLLLLDPREKSPLRDHFVEAWREIYGFGGDNSLIELVSGREARVQRVDVTSRTLYTGAIEQRRRADLINIIPPQQAGSLAQAAGLVDGSGWCPVDPASGESKQAEGIFVVGDAAESGLGRNAVAAHALARRCAHRLAAEQADADDDDETSYRIDEAIYSLITAKRGLVRRRGFALNDGVFEPLPQPQPRIAVGDALADEAVVAWKQLRKEIWG